jgi:hypothetical protein
MPQLSINPKDILQFAVRRHVTILFKEYLSLLETLAIEHDESLSKLATALPAEYHQYLALADYFTEDKSDRLRKMVLGRGNDCMRSIQDEISKYEVNFPTS